MGEELAQLVTTLPFGSNEIIILTGGSGFLGQHILRLLHERTSGVQEIRVVDVLPFKKKLDYVEKIPVVYYKGDVSIEEDLDRPFQGASIVIHTAAIVSVGHHVDRNQMRSVNVIGTSNVVLKCRQWNIPTLIVTSTVDAVFLKKSVFHFQKEEETELPTVEKDILMGYYGFTKAQAEAQVVCSTSITLTNGSKLRTATLRPTVLYGELDPYFIPTGMRVAKSCFGYLPRPLALIQESQFQATYAGNAAWAHLLAAWKLRVGEKLDKEVDGETFYVSDETEIGSIYDFMRPFLLLKGYKILNVWIPLFLILTGLQVFSWFVEKVFPIGWKKRLNKHPVIPTYQSFRMAHSELTLSKFKGKDRLGYEPIYSPGEAKMNSAKYYKSLQV